MNGRLYDPAIGRFISADPTIQYPDDMQNYNRYSYINNNPLSATDPSGHGFFGSFFSGISRLVSGAIRSVGRLLNNSFIRTIASIAVAYYLGPGPGALFGNAVANGAVAGFASGLIAGRGDLRTAISGAVTGGIFGFIGDIGIGSNIYEKTALHAFGGCFSAAFGGGDCKSGALSAGFAEGLGTSGALGGWGKYGNIARNAVIGGTASLASGGKFENGAMTGAFGYLFNKLGHPDIIVKPRSFFALTTSEAFAYGNTLDDAVHAGELTRDVTAPGIGIAVAAPLISAVSFPVIDYLGGMSLGQIKFDGPNKGFYYGNGRFFQIRYNKMPVFRIDYQATPASNGRPIWTLDFDAINIKHIPINPTSWFRN